MLSWTITSTYPNTNHYLFSKQVAVIEPVVATGGPKLIVGDEMSPLKMVEIKPPRQRQVDDDWFVLLDVAPKASGIYRVDFTIRWNRIETVMLKTEGLLCILH